MVAALLVVRAVPVAAAPLRVGVVDSETTYVNFAQQGWYQQRPPGTIDFLSSAGYDVVVLGDADLENRAVLDGLDVLFLPMTRVISEKASDTITSWVRAGGGLVTAFIGPRMHARAGCRWTASVHPRRVADWRPYWTCQGDSDGGFTFWYRDMNSNVWEWGPMSVMYGTRLVDDPTPKTFAVTDDQTHPIVSATERALGISSVRFDRPPQGAGAEFVARFGGFTTSLLRFSIPPGTGSAEGRDVSRYDGYTAAQAGGFGAGRFVYFDFNILDFLSQVNGTLAAQTHQGVTEGDIAGELLRQSISWVASPGSTVPVSDIAATRGEVDAWNGAIYVRQYVQAIGTHAVHGTAHIRIYDPNGRLVFQDQTVQLGLYPGQGELRYSYGYTPGSLASGTYRVDVDITFSHPAYDRIHLERALVSRGQGVGIPTQLVRADALPPRLAGADRYETAAAVSAATFGSGVPVAFVATGTDFPDALAGVPAAIRAGGPILLTKPDAIPAATRDELRRLTPHQIIVLGGPAAVSDRVLGALATYTGGTVRRLAGTNRYATAVEISKNAFPSGANVVYLATGENYPDALAAGPVAGLAGGPILLTTPTSLPSVTAAEIRRLSPATVVIMGGEAAVSSTVATAVARLGPAVSRLAGSHRYATAAAVSRSRFSPGVPVVYVATADGFPDALAGGVAAGMGGGPVLLVNASSIPTSTAGELSRLAPRKIVILGGGGVISTQVAAALAGYVAG